ncbi:hypothetical protein VNI00_004576 [Paramarasmius palmivorus]|uniref:F-box protein n=1 Tax=Paramarasmius palmivorus TaxID=297713 RepID=A0AAW0DJ18_9AGAR
MPPASIAVLSKALSLSHRIRVLEIEVHMHSHLTRAQALFHLLARRMPSLQSISITYVPGDTDSTNPQFNLLLPPTFLCGQTPSHTTVFHLERCHVSWSFVSKLTNLTHLHLDGSGDRMHRPSEMEFYRMLQRSPRLRELKLGVYAIPAATSATIPSLALTELRHLSLQSSIFSSETINCGRLLDHISFPTTAKLRLEIDGLSGARPTEPVIDILLPLFNSLAPHLQASSPDVYSVYRSAEIQCNVVKRDRSVNYESFVLKAWHEEFNSIDKFDACKGSKGISDVGVVCNWDTRLLQPHSSPTEQGKIATAALHIIPSAFIKTLYISLEFPPGPSTDFKFASLLAPYMHSTKLVRLFVCGPYCGAGVMRALSEASAERVALPALQAVTLINVSRPGKDGFELGTMQALISYLDCRIKHQVQLPVITIEPKGRGTSIDVTYEELFGWIVNRQHQPS